MSERQSAVPDVGLRRPIWDRLIVSGELHYVRIPREYWVTRLRTARAMGLNTVSTYAFWNVHETAPGAFDFSDWRDIAAFVREAQGVGLDVILRPGPYVCAEWDFGGLPAWLLADDTLRVRTADEGFTRLARRWFERLGQELAPFQKSRGGPIIAVQLENEAGATAAPGKPRPPLQGAAIVADLATGPAD